MPEYHIQSLSEYLSIISALEFHERGLLLFRGQGVNKPLLPGIGRATQGMGLMALSKEKNLLEQMRLMGASMLPPGDLSALDLMVVAQHFGLKTRLLDWSANPLVAMYFACGAADRNDAFVYVISVAGRIAADPYDHDPRVFERVVVIQPRLNNARVTAQDGWFTVHPYSLSDKAFIPVAEHEGHIVTIPGKLKSRLMKEIGTLGFTSRSMFPDLQGLAQYLNQQHLALDRWDDANS